MQLIKLDKIDSTNRYLKEKKELDDYDLVIAKTQTDGRGRRGNEWLSDEGAALFSFALRVGSSLKSEDYKKLPLITGLAVLEGLKEITGNDLFKFKWTNDVYLNNKKISGVLIEKLEDFFIIGIGINVNNKEFGELNSKATSIIKEFNQDYDIEEIIILVINKFKTFYNKLIDNKWNQILFDLNSYNYLRGKKITISYSYKEDLDGYAGDIMEDGMLEVLTDKGIIKIDTGEVHIKNIRKY